MQPNKDIYDPDYYNVKRVCEDAGYYWYDDCCNEKPGTLPWNEKEPLPEAGGHDCYTIKIGEWRIHWFYFLIAGMVVCFYLLLLELKNIRIYYIG